MPLPGWTLIENFLGISIFLFLIFTLGLLNRELSRREQAERSAAELKELLQSILDSCRDAVIVANAPGKIILRNPVGVQYNAGAPTDELSEKYLELPGLFKAARAAQCGILRCRTVAGWKISVFSGNG